MTTPDIRYVYLPFTDVRKSTTKLADGTEVPTRIVKGVMTDETVDMDGEIVDYESAKKAAESWFRDWGNVRYMHQGDVVAGAIGINFDDNAKSITTELEVVDPAAIVKVDKKLLKGQSVGLKGARRLADAKAPHGRLVGFEMVEDSLVDRPSNPSAKFAVTKRAPDGSMEIGEALRLKVATAEDDKLATVDDGKSGTSPLIGELVADIDGLNAPATNPAQRQTAAAPASDAGEDLDTNPGSALRRKKKPTPEVGGQRSQNAATQTPKTSEPEASKGYTPDSHGHAHTHNAGTDQEYTHDHGHDHVGGLHADGKPGDHQHDHWSKAAEPDAAKGSIIPGQAAATSSGEGVAEDVTSPSGATAGACPDGSCSCGGCGPSCTGDCCEACQMADDLDRRETMHFGADPDKTKALEEAIEAMYALVAPQIKAALEAGDTTKALSLLGDAEKLKGSIIAGQAGGNDTSDGVDVVPDPASGSKKKTKPEQGGAGSANDAPNADAITNPKTAVPDSMKAVLSEVTKAAVDAAVKPLRDEIEELKKRAQPGPMLGGLKQLNAPPEVQLELVRAAANSLDPALLMEMAQNHPDGTVRLGAKQLLAEIAKTQ